MTDDVADAIDQIAKGLRIIEADASQVHLLSGIQLIAAALASLIDAALTTEAS